MNRRSINAADAPAAAGGYAQAVEVRGAERMLFVSGQIPQTGDGHIPPSFREQCELVWHNVGAQLRAAGMSFDDVVKVTTFLSDRRHAAENGAIRRSVLGSRTPALTVIIAGIYDERWLLEIEVVAMA
jgi:enamine deaminase RidA (YjgF/YER057c/UK114 family)